MSILVDIMGRQTNNRHKLDRIDATLRETHRQTSGVRGAVMQRAQPERYAEMLEQRDAAVRDYFNYFFGARGSRLP